MFVVAAGLALFFFDQQSRIAMSSDYYFADFLIIMAAMVWVGYRSRKNSSAGNTVLSLLIFCLYSGNRNAGGVSQMVGVRVGRV